MEMFNNIQKLIRELLPKWEVRLCWHYMNLDWILGMPYKPNLLILGETLIDSEGGLAQGN